MKLLLDQGLPRGAAAVLREGGWDAVHTAEIEMARSLDSEILSRARGEQRVIVTLDSDFSMLLALSGASDPSVIHLRRQGLTANVTAALITFVLQECTSALEEGAVISLSEDSLRIRRLPILKT